MDRIESLDWHRGLLACSLMLYHLTIWVLEPLDSSNLLGRLGVYSVSMFFVLSGLSMAVVYNNYIQDVGSSVKFFVRRVFRIWPLLWIAVGIATGAVILTGKQPDWAVVALNLSTTFGFVSPDAAINIGAWSIGSEMVFYALTPAIIMAYNRRLSYGNLIAGATILIGLFFAFFVLRNDKPLESQWSIYVNPFNNLFLYCTGIGIFYNARSCRLGGKAALKCALIAIIVFLFVPVAGDQIHIVTGTARIIFSIASILLVLAFYKSHAIIPVSLRLPLSQLGAITYGVYLVHPIARQAVTLGLKKLHVELPALLLIGLIIMLTIAIALLSYRLVEQPFIRLGKRLTSRQATHATTAISAKGRPAM